MTITTRRKQRYAITNLLNIKAWNLGLNVLRQDVQERELLPTCASFHSSRDSFLSDSDGVKARLPRRPGVNWHKSQDNTEIWYPEYQNSNNDQGWY